jgi:hypothetical protein
VELFLCAGAGAIGAPLLFVFLKSRQQQTLTLGWVGIIILGFIPNFRFGLYHRGNDALAHAARSPGGFKHPEPKRLTRSRRTSQGRFGSSVCNGSFMGDYSAVYELEDIRSCAPLSNGEFINLIRSFPGVELSGYWRHRGGWIRFKRSLC